MGLLPWLRLLASLSLISLGKTQDVHIAMAGPKEPVPLQQPVTIQWVLQVRLPVYAHIIECDLPDHTLKKWNLKVDKPDWIFNVNVTYKYMVKGTVIDKYIEEGDQGVYTCTHVPEFGQKQKDTYTLTATGAVMAGGFVAAIVVPILLILIIIVIIIVVVIIKMKKRTVREVKEVKMREVNTGRRSVVRSGTGNTLSGEIIYVQPFHEGEEPTDPGGLIIYNEVKVPEPRSSFIHGSLDSVEYATLAWAQNKIEQAKHKESEL